MPHSHAGRCCKGIGPCRKSYVDYGTYLKNRKCVGPSDLCTLEYKIEHGKIDFGCISQPGGMVLIDCNLEVNAPQFIKLYAARNGHPGANKGTIVLDAHDYVNIASGGGAGCTTTVASGDVDVTASHDVRGTAQGQVLLQAGCDPCKSGMAGQTGSVSLAATTDVGVEAKDNIVIKAGCTGCTASPESPSWPYSDASSCCPCDYPTSGRVNIEGDAYVAAKGVDGVWLQAGCSVCPGPTGFTCGPTGGRMLLNAEGDLATISKKDVYIHAGACDNPSGKVNIHAPGGVYINGNVFDTDPAGGGSGGGGDTLRGETITIDASNTLALTCKSGSWKSSEDIQIDSSGSIISLSGTSNLVSIETGNATIHAANKLSLMGDAEIDASGTKTTIYGKDELTVHSAKTVDIKAHDSLNLNGHTGAISLSGATGTWDTAGDLTLSSNNLFVSATGYANINASSVLNIASHTIKLNATDPTITNTAVDITAKDGGISIGSSGPLTLTGTTGTFTSTQDMTISAKDVHIEPTGTSGYVYVGPVARTYDGTTTAPPDESPPQPTVYEAITSWTSLTGIKLTGAHENVFYRMYKLEGGDDTLGPSGAYEPTGLSAAAAGMQISLVNHQETLPHPDPLATYRTVHWSEPIQGVAGTSGYIHLYGGGCCTLTNMGGSWLCTSSSPSVSYHNGSVQGVFPLVSIGSSATAPAPPSSAEGP